MPYIQNIFTFCLIHLSCPDDITDGVMLNDSSNTKHSSLSLYLIDFLAYVLH